MKPPPPQKYHLYLVPVTYATEQLFFMYDSHDFNPDVTVKEKWKSSCIHQRFLETPFDSSYMTVSQYGIRQSKIHNR